MSEVARIYSIGYRNKHGLQPVSQAASPYHKGLLKRMELYRQAGCILDVGCFTGKFLSAAKEAGWRPFGLEISAGAVEHARSQLGLDVRQETLLQTTLESETFDVITMLDVVEHFQEPLQNLKKAAQLLRPKGLLYLETPNLSSLARYLLGKNWNVFFPWHFYYFTARTIRHALELAGFRIVKIQAVDVGPLSRFNAFRGIENSGSISEQNLAKRLKNQGLVNAHPGPFRAAYHFVRNVENISFKGMSLLGIHVGGKLVVWAERV
jgi:SAM-dependent methyltransferase